MTDAQLRRIQEMEARMARVPTTETKPVEQPLAPQPQPRSRLPIVTVESPVVQPIVEPSVQYFPPAKLDPPLVKREAPIETEAPAYLPTSEHKPVNRRDVGRRWKIGIAVFLVLVLILVEMWFVLS
jgi:hypothetical protein